METVTGRADSVKVLLDDLVGVVAQAEKNPALLKVMITEMSLRVMKAGLCPFFLFFIIC